MGCSVTGYFTYCFWSIITVCGGVVVYVILGKEKEEFPKLDDIKFWRCLIRFVYKLLRHRKQGVLTLHKDLNYIAECGDDSYSLVISARNHRLTAKRLR